MADAHKLVSQHPKGGPEQPWRLSVEEAREKAKERFRDRVSRGQKVGGCSCHDEEESVETNGNVIDVVGVRFRDSGRVYFFESGDHDLNVGDWVVVSTSRGEEAARVVVAPRQMLMSQLDGHLKPIRRMLSDEDVAQIEHYRKESIRALKRAGELSRARNLTIKVVAAEFSFDGSRLKISYTAPEHVDASLLQRLMENEVNCPVDMLQIGPREEARLIGGLGKCGRTLCCASWLPIYPDVSMGMVKNQDLSLNPSKVSGLCGRLLCCLSYENEQYKQARAIMPRLGQRVVTDEGEGMVVSLQILKELVTVRYTDPHREQTYPASEILTGAARRARDEARSAAEVPAAEPMVVPDDNPGEDEAKPKRRRRRRGGRSRGGNSAAPPTNTES